MTSIIIIINIMPKKLHKMQSSNQAIKQSNWVAWWLGGLFLATTGFCEFSATTHLIDIPTAYSANTSFSIGVNSSITTKEDSYPTDNNAYIEIEVLKRLNIGLSILTRKVSSLEVKLKANDETKNMPAIAIGSKYLSPHKWICPVGVGRNVGWDDDETYNYKRTPEQFSLFVVATKDMGPYGVYNIGIGNGCFVGYGPRSHLFNSDMFSGEYHSNAIGLFWGMEILLLPYLFGVFDFDGRDFNVGIKIRNDIFQLGIAASKLEHRLKGALLLYPRFTIGANVNSLIMKNWLNIPTGSLTVVVRDAKSGNPERAVVSFPGTSLPSAKTDKERGTCTIRLPAGTYWVRTGIVGYHWAEKKVYISPRMTTICFFEIYSILP